MIKRKLQSGFSLVETLVAITILLIVVVGPMTLSTSTARSTNFSSQQVQAFFLAQEGVELVQAYRDDELLQAFPDVSSPPTVATKWTDFEGMSDCFDAGGCGLDVDTDIDASFNIADCSTIANCRVYYNEATDDVRSRYNQSGTGVETEFTRVITAEVVNSGSEVKVESTVTWRSGNLREQQAVSVVTYLFNVYENL